MEVLLSILVGLGLSASCGFRVFVPLLVMSVAAQTGHLSLHPGFEWIGSWPATLAFATATALEVSAYFIPFLDNLLDTVASPAAIVAGTLVTASVVTGLSPFLRWTLALVAGGGLAGLVQASTVGLRGLSSATTGGTSNPGLALGELVASGLMSALSLVVPALALMLLATAGLMLLRTVRRRSRA